MHLNYFSLPDFLVMLSLFILKFQMSNHKYYSLTGLCSSSTGCSGPWNPRMFQPFSGQIPGEFLRTLCVALRPLPHGTSLVGLGNWKHCRTYWILRFGFSETIYHKACAVLIKFSLGLILWNLGPVVLDFRNFLLKLNKDVVCSKKVHMVYGDWGYIEVIH
jgi:hypothetical protein